MFGKKKESSFDSLQGLYVIRDMVANDFSPIYQAQNDDVARRLFLATIRKTQFPQDFELIKIGTFDVVTLDLAPVTNEVVKITDIEKIGGETDVK